MNRLQAELQRLFFFPGAPGEPGAHASLAGPDGTVRAMVLQLAGAGGWDALSAVWQGVQADLELPAPAIAVVGDAYQLWFALAQPVPAQDAAAFLEGLRMRYLAGVLPARVTALPAADGDATVSVPPREVATGCWSAFVAPDLASLFAEETWLDLPPSADAQADLLSRLQVAGAADFARARERLAAGTPPDGSSANAAQAAPQAALPQHADARRFLLDVMNDPVVDLALRIEAAKALLPYSGR